MSRQVVWVCNECRSERLSEDLPREYIQINTQKISKLGNTIHREYIFCYRCWDNFGYHNVNS